VQKQKKSLCDKKITVDKN